MCCPSPYEFDTPHPVKLTPGIKHRCNIANNFASLDEASFANFDMSRICITFWDVLWHRAISGWIAITLCTTPIWRPSFQGIFWKAVVVAAIAMVITAGVGVARGDELEVLVMSWWFVRDGLIKWKPWKQMHSNLTWTFRLSFNMSTVKAILL